MTILDEHNAVAYAAGIALDIRAGSITIDDTWMPLIQGSIEIATPADPSIIDPRTSSRVELHLRQRFGQLAFIGDITDRFAGGTLADITAAWAEQTLGDLSELPERYFNQSATPQNSTSTVLDLRVRSASTDSEGITTVELEGDEAILMELVSIEAAQIGGERRLRESFQQALDTAVSPDYAFNTEIIPGDVNPRIPVGLFDLYPSERWVFIDFGDSVYEAYTPVLQSSNTRFISFTGKGLDIVTADYTVEGFITIYEAQNLVEFRTAIARDDDLWADAVIIVYSREKTVSPNYLVSVSDLTTGWTRPLVIRVDAPSPVGPFMDGAPADPANAILSRMLRRGAVAPVRAVNNYDTFPRKSLILHLPGQAYTGLVQAVTFEIGGNWEMDVVAQELETV